MKKYLFRNNLTKAGFFITCTVIALYLFFAFAFKDKDILRVKRTPAARPLELYFDKALTQKVTLPFNNNKSPEIFTFYAKLPDVRDCYVVEIDGKYKVLSASIDGLNFYNSEIPLFMGIKTYAGRNIAFVPLNSRFSDRLLSLSISLQKNFYGSSIHNVAVTTIPSYEAENFTRCLPSYVLAGLLMVCAIFSLNAFLFSYLYQKKRTAVDFDISVETFLVSLSIVVWIVTNFDVLGVFVKNTTMIGLLNYLSFTTMPVFFSAFLLSINPAWKKILHCLQVGAELNLFIQFILFVTGIADFTQMLFLTHLVDLFGVALTIIVVFDLTSVRKYSREQKLLCIGSAIFAFFTIVSLVLFIFRVGMDYMFLITMGFFILFGMHMATSLLKLNLSLKEHQQLLESERNSYRDQLTSLGNRRLLYRKIAKLEALGFDSEMNFIIIDVNGLKTINDTLGHDAGDELLVGTAVCISESFPDAELLCRMGGDEFFIIVREGAEVLERRMKRFLHYAEHWNGKFIHTISMSYGIANLSKFPGYSIKELEKAADEEMYKYKSAWYESRHVFDDALDGRR